MKLGKRFFFFLLAISLLSGDIEDYFKTVINKSESSQIKNIDFIYLINLDERPEKLKKVVEMLSLYDIHPCRFSAVNGWKLSVADVNQLGVQYEPWMPSDRWGTYYPIEGSGAPQHELVSVPGRSYFCHCLAFGSIGCVLSHLSVLQDALDSNYELIWVMEDDIEIHQDPHLLSDRIEELNEAVGSDGWDVLFTDRDTKNQEGEYVPCSSYAWRPNYTPPDPYRFAEKREISAHIMKIGARYGSYSMLIKRSGIRKILSFIKCHGIFLPYDMEYTQPGNIRLFTLKEDIVSTQPRAPSDNGNRNYD